jgi:methionyl-tRNA formyltransferase
LRVGFAGTPEFAVPALHALARSSHELVGVLTQPDRPSGRGRVMTPSAVKNAAREYGLPVAQPESLRTPDARDDLAAWRADVLVVVAYGLLLPRDILCVSRHGCVNIHASLLPRWRGAAPIQRAILAGDDETGVSIMLMDEGLDTGPLLLQRRLAIDAAETAGELEARLAQAGAEALLEALTGWPGGALTPQVQTAQGATYARKIDKTEALIDWSRDADSIARQVRAFNPRPIAETTLDGEQLRIHAAQARTGGPGGLPGEVLGTESGGIAVRCGAGSLLLTQVQRPGRRPIPARELASATRLAGRVLGARVP